MSIPVHAVEAPPPLTLGVRILVGAMRCLVRVTPLSVIPLTWRCAFGYHLTDLHWFDGGYEIAHCTRCGWRGPFTESPPSRYP